MLNVKEDMNFELDKLSLIDISSEDDFLIDSQLRSDSFTGFRLSVAFENGHDMEKFKFKSKSFPAETTRSKVMNSDDLFDQMKEESAAQDERCNNARKSLAWDSAFFTSAGVLDSEELSMINKGFRKTTKITLLPGINEELQGAAESNCTSDSNLDSFEINLFKDKKQTNQKSTKLEVTPRNIRNARSRESHSTPQLRPPSKLSGRSKSFPAATPSKRSGFGTAGTASKKPCLGTSCNAVTPSSTKSYFSGPSTVTSVKVSSSSAYDSYENASSESTNKSLWNSFRRNKTRLDSLGSSTCKNSLPRLSYCLSPASSTDHWSANKEGYKISKENIDYVHGKEGLFDLHATGASDLESTPTSGDVTSHLRASGLRFPSPKYGYFDMEESPAKTPNELNVFPVQQESSDKQATETSHPTGVSNGLMHDKFQAVRSVTGTTRKSTSQSRKLKQTSSTVAITSRTNQTKSQPTSSPKLEPQKQFKNPKGLVPSNNRHTTGKTNNGLVNSSRSRLNQDKKVHEKGNQQRHEKNRYSSYAVFGKENTLTDKDQVDDLCKRFGSLDPSKDDVIGL